LVAQRRDQFNDQYVKVAKLCGQLARHSHENEDELFYVLSDDLKD
jgi:uncharacterized cupin superfamily protein